MLRYDRPVALTKEQIEENVRVRAITHDVHPAPLYRYMLEATFLALAVAS